MKSSEAMFLAVMNAILAHFCDCGKGGLHFIFLMTARFKATTAMFLRYGSLALRTLNDLEWDK